MIIRKGALFSCVVASVVAWIGAGLGVPWLALYRPQQASRADEISFAVLTEPRLLKISGSRSRLSGDRVLVSGGNTRHDVRMIRQLSGERCTSLLTQIQHLAP